ncbi:MAG: peptide chain release factor 2 [Acutalibacteraceae bacterium]
MLQYEELRLTLENLRPELHDLADALGLEKMANEVAELELKASQPGFWDNAEESQKVLQRSGALKGKIEAYDKLRAAFDDTLALIELADEEGDLSLLEEARQGVETVREEMETQRLSTLLTGEYDARNAILTLHAGAGGTEAQDWALMLYRMYCRWGERHNFKVSTVDMLDGEEAGIKSATITIEGENAYGYLKGENGVHRLVRVSPFDASGRRHTSFASLEVIPEIDDSIHVDIAPEDIKMDVFRSSGAGGQHINKTSSAVRLTHLPTGIVVSCQTERSQFQNRDTAMKMLVSKLMEIKEREHLATINDIKGVQKEIAWGSQIRSYVFMPYTLAKDHRTGFESGNINAVMDGDIDGFINAYLKAQNLKNLDTGEDDL